MICSSNNHTRYNTGDLNALFDAAREIVLTYQVKSYYQSSPENKQWRFGSAVDSVESIQSLYGEEMPAVSMGDSVLKIKTVSGLSSHEDLQLAMLGQVSSGILPDSVVYDMLVVIACRACPSGYGHNRWAALQDQVREYAKCLAADHKIRIMPRIESPPESRKPLTREQKLKRMLSDSFYGSGGVLEGPSWAWRNGNRSPTGRWAWKLDDCQRYYERELSHRLGHAEKVRELGGEPTPYETFPQYLRRMADSLENSCVGKDQGPKK